MTNSTPHAELRPLPDGRQVGLRPATPADAPRLPRLSISRIHGSTGVEGRGTIALVALDDRGEVVAHAACAAGPGDGGMALDLAPGWEGSGLDRLLLADLVRAARDSGASRLTGEVALDDRKTIDELRGLAPAAHVRPRRHTFTVDLDLG